MTTWNQRVAEIKARLRAASGPGFSGAEHEDTHEERWDGRVIIGEGWWESDQEYPNERADAVFLTHAYDDISDLLSENERLLAALEAALNPGEVSGKNYTERELRAARSALDKIEKLRAQIEADRKPNQTKREEGN